MRIRVLGQPLESAVSVKDSLRASGVVVSDEGYSFTVELYDTSLLLPIVDGVDCRLEALIVSRISDLADTRIILDRPGSNHSDRHIRIGVPLTFTDSQKAQLERAVMQAIVQLLTGPPEQPMAISPDEQPIAILSGRVDALANAVSKWTNPWWKLW